MAASSIPGRGLHHASECGADFGADCDEARAAERNQRVRRKAAGTLQRPQCSLVGRVERRECGDATYESKAMRVSTGRP
eukprot:1029854-Pleurochrysis_carterae.AAC.1